MQKFEFRGPRFSVNLPVQFILKDATLTGLCTDISKEGLRLELEQPLQSNSSGTVAISHQGNTVEFRVRVVHAEDNYGGLKFIYSTNAERRAIAQLVDSLSAPRH